MAGEGEATCVIRGGKGEAPVPSPIRPLATMRFLCTAPMDRVTVQTLTAGMTPKGSLPADLPSSAQLTNSLAQKGSSLTQKGSQG